MNRVIQELSLQMSNHLSAGHVGSEGQASNVQTKYKKRITDLQGELKTEQSLHEITKTSLQALEDDCQRLRSQLIGLRKREPHTSEKYVKLLHFFLSKND